MQKKRENTNYTKITTETLGSTYGIFAPVPDMTALGQLVGDGLDYVGDGIGAAVKSCKNQAHNLYDKVSADQKNETSHWNSLKKMRNGIKETSGNIGQDVGDTIGTVIDICLVGIPKGLHYAFSKDKNELGLFNSGIGYLLGKAGKFIGKGIGAAIGFIAASGAYVLGIGKHNQDTSNGKKLDVKASNKRASTSYGNESPPPNKRFSKIYSSDFTANTSEDKTSPVVMEECDEPERWTNSFTKML